MRGMRMMPFSVAIQDCIGSCGEDALVIHAIFNTVCLVWLLRIIIFSRFLTGTRETIGFIHHVENEETMDTMRKCLVMSGAGVIGAAGLLLIVKAARHRHHMSMYEKVGKGIDEKLKESMAALDKATAHVQTVFEHMKSRKQ